MDELTCRMEADWSRSRRRLRERLASSHWWVVIAASDEGYLAVKDLSLAAAGTVDFCYVPVARRGGPVIACTARRGALPESRLQEIVSRYTPNPGASCLGPHVLVISSPDDREQLCASFLRAIATESKGRCVACGNDLYEDDFCSLCCHNMRQVVHEVGPRVRSCHHEALSRGFADPVVLLLNVFDRAGRQLCEELKGAREVDRLVGEAECEGQDMTLAPHPMALEQLAVVLGDQYDPGEIGPLLAMRHTHILGCVISEIGPVFMTVSKRDDTA